MKSQIFSVALLSLLTTALAHSYYITDFVPKSNFDFVALNSLLTLERKEKSTTNYEGSCVISTNNSWSLTGREFLGEHFQKTTDKYFFDLSTLTISYRGLSLLKEPLEVGAKEDLDTKSMYISWIGNTNDISTDGPPKQYQKYIVLYEAICLVYLKDENLLHIAVLAKNRGVVFDLRLTKDGVTRVFSMEGVKDK